MSGYLSIVIKVLIDDWWISASFPFGVPLATYILGTEYAFLYEKAAGVWYWPGTYVWCRRQKIVEPFHHLIVPVLNIVRSTGKQLYILPVWPVCASDSSLVVMQSVTFPKKNFLYSKRKYFVSIYSLREVPTATQANLLFASTLLGSWPFAI